MTYNEMAQHLVETTGKIDRTQILLKSDVVSDQGCNILSAILETGKVSDDATDNYSKNYRKFLELYNTKSVDDAPLIYHFINTILNYTILLPIEADNQETALTIFNTLNNRGLPLSDADIFKSYLYKGLDEEGKKHFQKSTFRKHFNLSHTFSPIFCRYPISITRMDSIILVNKTFFVNKYRYPHINPSLDGM